MEDVRYATNLHRLPFLIAWPRRAQSAGGERPRSATRAGRDRAGGSHAQTAPRVASPMRLHDYAASGNCYKVRLLLALLGQPYERVPVDIFAGDTLTDEFAALNPARTTPVLELDDGRALPES